MSNWLGPIPPQIVISNTEVILAHIHSIISGGGGGGAGLATEATLLNVLNAVQNIEIDADTINLNTDGIETLITASNVLLTAIDLKLAFSAHSAIGVTGPVSAAGATVGGEYSIIIHNVGVGIGIVNGAPLVAGASRTYTAGFKKTLPRITYSGVGTVLYIENLNY